jgi:hypothetical protein
MTARATRTGRAARVAVMPAGRRPLPRRGALMAVAWAIALATAVVAGRAPAPAGGTAGGTAARVALLQR